MAQVSQGEPNDNPLGEAFHDAARIAWKANPRTEPECWRVATQLSLGFGHRHRMGWLTNKEFKEIVLRMHVELKKLCATYFTRETE